MLSTEYLYLGGPLDGQWRVPPDVGAHPIPEVYAATPDDKTVTYVPTKFGQMGHGGEFRMSCYAMVAEDLHTRLVTFHDPASPLAGYRKRLERALVHRLMRECMQRIWRVPEVLDFGPAWLAMERLPARPRIRPIRDNPQA